MASMKHSKMLRLRLMHRLGLLGPLLRLHRSIEDWELHEPEQRRGVAATRPRRTAV
jgi:hypothetical protein